MPCSLSAGFQRYFRTFQFVRGWSAGRQRLPISSTATRQPFSDSRSADTAPPNPEPMTTKSYAGGAPTGTSCSVQERGRGRGRPLDGLAAGVPLAERVPVRDGALAILPAEERRLVVHHRVEVDEPRLDVLHQAAERVHALDRGRDLVRRPPELLDLRLAPRRGGRVVVEDRDGLVGTTERLDEGAELGAGLGDPAELELEARHERVRLLDREEARTLVHGRKR